MQGKASPTWLATVLLSLLGAALLLRLVRARQSMPARPMGVPLEQALDSPVYRAKPVYTAGIMFLSLLMVLSGLAGAWLFGAVIDSRDTPVAMGLAAAVSLFAAAGVLIALNTTAFRLILRADVLEIHDLFRVRWARACRWSNPIARHLESRRAIRRLVPRHPGSGCRGSPGVRASRCAP